MFEVEITPDAVIALLMATASPKLVSVLDWTVQVALSDLENRLGSNSAIGRALERWPRSVGAGGRVFVGVKEMLHRRVLAGDLVIEGAGAQAAYRATPGFANDMRKVVRLLRRDQRLALQRSTQRLIACFSTLSKNSPFTATTPQL
jgi:hypothetical protein